MIRQLAAAVAIGPLFQMMRPGKLDDNRPEDRGYQRRPDQAGRGDPEKSITAFRPLLQLVRPGEMDNAGPEDRRDDRVGRVVGQPDREEPEDEVRAVPVPRVLVQDCEDDENYDEYSSWLLHLLPMA